MSKSVIVQLKPDVDFDTWSGYLPDVLQRNVVNLEQVTGDLPNVWVITENTEAEAAYLFREAAESDYVLHVEMVQEPGATAGGTLNQQATAQATAGAGKSSAMSFLLLGVAAYFLFLRK